MKLVEWKNVMNGVEFTISHPTGFMFKLITQINRTEDPNRFRMLVIFSHRIDMDQYYFYNQFYKTYREPGSETLRRYWIEPESVPNPTFMCHKITDNLVQIPFLLKRVELTAKNYYDEDYKKRLKEVEVKPPLYKDVDEI